MQTVSPSKLGVVLTYSLSVTQVFSQLVTVFATVEQGAHPFSFHLSAGSGAGLCSDHPVLDMNTAERVSHYSHLPTEGALTASKEPAESWRERHRPSCGPAVADRGSHSSSTGLPRISGRQDAVPRWLARSPTRCLIQDEARRKGRDRGSNVSLCSRGCVPLFRSLGLTICFFLAEPESPAFSKLFSASAKSRVGKLWSTVSTSPKSGSPCCGSAFRSFLKVRTPASYLVVYVVDASFFRCPSVRRNRPAKSRSHRREGRREPKRRAPESRPRCPDGRFGGRQGPICQVQARQFSL